MSSSTESLSEKWSVDGWTTQFQTHYTSELKRFTDVQRQLERSINNAYHSLTDELRRVNQALQLEEESRRAAEAREHNTVVHESVDEERKAVFYREAIRRKQQQQQLLLGRTEQLQEELLKKTAAREQELTSRIASRMKHLRSPAMEGGEPLLDCTNYLMLNSLAPCDRDSRIYELKHLLRDSTIGHVLLTDNEPTDFDQARLKLIKDLLIQFEATQPTSTTIDSPFRVDGVSESSDISLTRSDHTDAEPADEDQAEPPPEKKKKKLLWFW